MTKEKKTLNSHIALPVTRKQQFVFSYRSQFATLIKTSFLLALFSVPLFLVVIFQGVFIGNLELTAETTQREINAFLSRQIIYDLSYIPAILILSVGLAGAYTLMKEFAMGDGFTFAHSFFGGIKRNAKEFVLVALVFSAVLYLLQFGVNYLSMFGMQYYVPALTVAFVLLLLLADCAVFAMCMIPVYKNGPFRTLKNAWLFTFSQLPRITGLMLITWFPLFVVSFFGSLVADAIVLFAYIVLGFGNAVLATTLFCLYCFDEQVNKKRFTQIYKKGLYTPAAEEEEEAEEPFVGYEAEETIDPGYLTVEGIGFSYPDGTRVLDGVSFALGEKDVLCVAGASGAGKTTLLRVLSGALYESEGDVSVKGVSQKPILPCDRGFAYCFQSPNLYLHLTVYQNLLMAYGKEKIDFAEKDEQIKEQLKRFDLLPYINVKAKYLSLGERQKTAIAKSLLRQRKLYLFDEPMSAMDVRSRRKALNCLRAAKKERNVPFVFVHHDKESVFSFATKVLVLKDGKGIQFDAPQNILKDPQNIVCLYTLSEEYNYIPCRQNGAERILAAKKKHCAVSENGRYVARIVRPFVNESGEEWLECRIEDKKIFIAADGSKTAEAGASVRFDVVGENKYFDGKTGDIVREE